MDRRPAQLPDQRGRSVSALDAAKANDSFEIFLNASTLKTILGTYRNICELIHLKPNVVPLFYPKLKAHLTSWRAKALWKKFDLRANNKVYGKGKLCPNTRVLIIGGGPCGLRTAIEAQLLGAKVVVIEKRDRMSRNNVLHLWPFVIDDLRSLGAKKFFGKFCAGAIDHISIRQLQCILLKVALLLGVEVHTEISFERLIEPNTHEKTGWRAECKPAEHPVSQFEFDVIIGADGKRNTLQGFKRKEFRGKLAIAITANFINKRTEAEARVEEISGVAFIFNQKFFKDLYSETGIDLENIVYYKDDTHYFVMTAKKPSLIDKGVIKQDLPDTAKLLAPDNVDREALMNYAREAAEFSTNYNMLDLEFAVNHYGQPDVAMFDFTSMYAAENASRIMEKNGYKLLTILVGDSLLEPFWPTGSGCARGFLSSMDAAWAIRGYGTGMLTALEVLAERESIYRLLAQTTPENLNKDYKGYTLDPTTRYPNLNRNVLLAQQVLSLYDTDNPTNIELSRGLVPSIQEGPKKRRRRESYVDPDVLHSWIKEQVKEHIDLDISNITTSFKDGRILCAIISHYRPDLLDYSTINSDEPVKNNQIAVELLEKELGIPPVLTGEEIANCDVPDFLTMVSYLTQIYDTFRCEIPHIKHPKLQPMTASLLPAKVKLLQKSKFSMVDHTKRERECLCVHQLNLTPLKSIEDYSVNNNQYNNIDSVERDNSKSLVFKMSGSDYSNEINMNTNDIHTFHTDTSKVRRGRAKLMKEKCHKKLNVLTKSAYIMESKILQEKIDLAVKNNVKRARFLFRDNKKSESIMKFENRDHSNCNIAVEDYTGKSNMLSLTKSEIQVLYPIKDCVLNNNCIKETNDEKVSDNIKDKETACCCCRLNKNNLNNHQLKEGSRICSKASSVDVEVVLNDGNHLQRIILNPITNCVNILFPRIVEKLRCNLGINQEPAAKTKIKSSKCQQSFKENKLLSLTKMSQLESNQCIEAEHTFDRVVNWISASNFDIRNGTDSPKTSSIQIDGLTDITSVTRQNMKRLQNNILIEKVTDIVQFMSDGTKQLIDPKQRESLSMESITKFMQEVNSPDNGNKIIPKLNHNSPNRLYKKRMRSRSEPSALFSIIAENEENELPETKRVENAFTKNHPVIKQVLTPQPSTAGVNALHRPSSRHKRHAIDPPAAALKSTMVTERKPRKRKTMDKLSITNVEDRMKRLEEISQNRMDRHSKRRQQRKMQTDQFIKSMQMLQANCKPDHSEPFEDYSLFVYRQTAPNFEDRVKDLEKKFTYIPDRENRMPVPLKGEKDEDFQARIKGMEDKWREHVITEKKPKDLLRAIGKIDNSDWNIKQIEKKIIENKLGKNVNKDKEKVPKWSREQFLARQTKMEKQHLERQDSTGGKFAEIDRNIKQLDQKLKEGTVRDQNRQKVAMITQKLKPKGDAEPKPIQKSNSKAVVIPTQGNSELCHFCAKRVYLMERLSAEGRFFHRGCFRCQYCHISLRLGSYLYDRDGKYGYRFYCSQHFGLVGELKTTKLTKKSSMKHRDTETPPKKVLSGLSGVDLLDRVQTPERIEFANLTTGNASSDHEESLSQMDEDEWTDRNFGASTTELGSSDDDSSSISDTDSDDEDAYEEALEEPPTKEGTLKWAERYNRRYSKKNNDSESDGYSSSDQSSYYENSSGDDESDTATEGEEEIRARELRKQEVRVEPPVVHTDTGTDTEIASDENSTESSSEVHNSATEISTDSEFAQDDPTPTREVPSIVFNDMYVTKTRGKISLPQRVHVKSSEIQKSINIAPSRDIELKFTPLILTPIAKKAPLLKSDGYALNRTQSTGGIATKVSLELKKKYLLGESAASNSIQKSGSASTLDSKFKSFHSNISDCQKLLKPAVESSKLGQTFVNKLNDRSSPVSPVFAPQPFILPEKPQSVLEKEIDIATEPQLNKDKDECAPSFENENEGRPRSPVHETSIIVPQIDWSLQKQINNNSSESSSSSSSSDSEINIMQKSPSIKTFGNIPKLEMDHVNLTIDSLNFDVNSIKTDVSNDPPKSISSEKKVLNQPKTLPNLDSDILHKQVHSVLHNRSKSDDKPTKNSGRSTSSNDDQITAILTETELSDWARDGTVSEDFEDVEYELNPDLHSRRNRKPKTIKRERDYNKKSATPEKAELKHICGKDSEKLSEYVNNILNPELDNIEFMDTGTESSEEDVVEVKNNGYVQFHDEDDIIEDSLSPVINVVETRNPIVKATFDEDFDDLSTLAKNTGYCIIGSEEIVSNPFGGEVIDLQATDLEKLKEKSTFLENEEDSLLIVEPGTTTDENTCSDSTVKNITEITFKPQDIKALPDVQENNNLLDKKRLEDKLAQVKKDMKKLSEQRRAEQIEEQNIRNNIEFEQHCQRLQSKVDFGNAKDSIDIRKSRRQSKTGSPPKPDLIQEEKEASPIRSRREQIEIERDINKKLIEEMVMNKMKAQNKSLERKRRTRNSFSPSISPSRPFDLTKSTTTDLSKINNPTPDVLLSTLNPQLNSVQKSHTVSVLSEYNKEATIIPRNKYPSISKSKGRPISVHNTILQRPTELTETPNNSEALSLPDIHKAVTLEEFKTPKPPPRLKNEEAKRVVEKLKEDARARARLLSDEDLGLSPEDKLAKLRQRVNRRCKESDSIADIKDSIESLVINTEKRNSIFYTNDTLNKKKHHSFRRSKSGEDPVEANSTDARERTKSVSEISHHTPLRIKVNKENIKENLSCFKSDPNLTLPKDNERKKPKDRERRKSITKIFTDLFGKKKDLGASNKGFLSRISPKSKDKSKDTVKVDSVRRMSLTTIKNIVPGNVSPPPIPPLPLNYTGTKSGVDDSSDGECDWKRVDRSSCDTLDQSTMHDGTHRRSSRSARKVARQSQLKRHRMAQEIQRKLEETEVKTRELEQRGVKVEMALRGEAEESNIEESELLKEWFDLMRDMTELRRYERELMVRAQELELEDRHARLQHELKERLSNDDHKTREDFETEGSILKEMMEIVSKRDSLIALLEEDRLRYSAEDKGFEEQLLAKGINLTPVIKVSDK